MENVSLKDAMLEWQKKGKVRVLKHPAKVAKEEYNFCVGACFSDWDKMTKQKRLLQLYLDAWTAIIRDGVSPQVMHKALLSIPEYRQSLAIDSDGAE